MSGQLGEVLFTIGPITVVVGLAALGMLVFCMWDYLPCSQRAPDGFSNGVEFDAMRAKQRAKEGVQEGPRSDDC